VLPAELSPLDESLQQLAADGYAEIDKKKGIYKPTSGYRVSRRGDRRGPAHGRRSRRARHDDASPSCAHATSTSCALSWGWYEGEFDDLVLFH
jgi:hypothetical protein